MMTRRVGERIKEWYRENRIIGSLLVLLLVGLNILVFSKISFVFKPIIAFVEAITLPVLLTGVVYYLLNPIVNYLESKRMKRVTAVLLLYVFIILLILILVLSVFPLVNEQIASFVQNVPEYTKQLQENMQKWIGIRNIDQVGEWIGTESGNWISKISGQFTSVLENTFSGLGSIVGAVTSVVIAIVTVPFILFFLLKDGKKLPGYLLEFIPTRMRGKGLRVLSEINNQISSYIRGQIIVSFCIGILLYIGYLIIGMNYSLVLAIIAACTSIIPYLGPTIAITPALIVAIATSPAMLVKLIVIWTVVQLFEGKFISPNIMGKSLSIHPVTIIFVMLTAGRLFGVPGIILAVPGYAVLKVIFTHSFQWFKERSSLYETIIITDSETGETSSKV